jgi:hypothetical protein
MAVAIPLIAMGMGASAWTVAAITIAASATGVSKKVNEAAAGVFGEDLVNAANIAGSVWMAYSAFNPDSAYSVGNVFGGSSSAAATSSAETAASTAAAEGANAAAPAGGALPAGGGTDAVVAGSNAGASGGVLPQAAAQSTAGATEAAASGIKTFGETLPTSSFTSQAVTPLTTNVGGQLANVSSVQAPAATGFFDGMSDWQKYGLMQAGGQMLSGTMQGAAQAESMEQQRAWQLEDAARYRSGSGMTSYYARRPVFAAVGAPAISPPGNPPGMIPGLPQGGFVPPQQYGPQPLQVGPNNPAAYYGLAPTYGRR